MSEESKAAERAESREEPADEIVETTASARIGGRQVEYRVTCGTIVLREEVEQKGEEEGAFEGHRPRASVFFVAYTRTDAGDDRPITFSFNGGPGSSSVWLHLGALGPRRVEMGDVGALTPPPYDLVDNEHSLLDVTDLVFIDPVGTGFSRAVEGEKAKEFHRLKKDVESVGEFIRLYATRYGRWRSPKFLIGESYGTTRAAALASHLQERHGMYLNGVMLVSVALDFSTIFFQPGNDLPHVLFLPGYTAAAWYHGRLPDELQDDLGAALVEAEEFAVGEYAHALLRGARLEADERAAVARKMARLTGLDPEYVERSDLRVTDQRYFKELLRADGRTIGRLDCRFTGADRDGVGETPEVDPSMTAILGPYATALNDYVRRELGFESDLPYETLSFKVNEQWVFERDNEYVRVSEELRKALAANPHLQVFVASGLFDLGTPYFATDYTLDHIPLPAEQRANITVETYEAGHMMYVHLPSLAKLKADLEAFLSRSLAAGSGG